MVYNLFQKYGSTSNPKFWGHAEDFLEFVDSATEEPSSARRQMLEGFVGGLGGTPTSVEQFRWLAILSVAAECSAFVDRGHVKSELWDPYVEWAKKLGPNDTVITFNYDQVLERLGTAEDVTLVGERSVVRPHQKVKEGTCPVFKLHGSTTWGVDKTGGFSAFNTNQFVDSKFEYRNLIATPGATKLSHCEGLLKPLWSMAVERLKAADVVVFMGYRFPPSDSFSRRVLLGAIRDNDQPYLRIHTVLGPDRPTDTSRLVTLLDAVLDGRGRFVREDPKDYRGNHYNIVPQPLYVQDFLTVYTQKMLEVG